MKNKLKNLMTDWESLMVRVLTLGITVFLWSYITEINGVTEMFGDISYKPYSTIDVIKYKWGFRHWVYTSTFTIITIIQIARMWTWVECRLNDNGFKVKCKENE